MKSGILATTTLLVILGTVEQVQAQTETDRDREYDFTEFSYGSDPTPAATVVAEENNPDNGYGSLAWQTDFATISSHSEPSFQRGAEGISAIANPDELASLSPVPEPETPLLADLRTEQTGHNRADWSNQFRPHVPTGTATRTRRPEAYFPEGTNREPTAIENYRNNNPQGSVEDRQRKLGPSSISTATILRQVTPLSTHSVNQPEIPPLAAVTNYLPEAPQELPVFNGYSWPAQGTISSHYGWRWGRMHSGIDIAGPVGTPIVAAADGVVITSEWNDGGYGNLVEIEHPDGSITLYAHNSQNRVGVGEVVKQGQLIALMGSTGYSTGPHLHFEVLLPGQGAVNPSAYLPSGDSVAHQHW